MTSSGHRAVPVKRRLPLPFEARTPGLLLVVLVSLRAVAGPNVVDVERASLTTDAGVVEVTGGVWLSDKRAEDIATERVMLRERNATLTKQAGAVEASTIVTVACVSAALGGVAGAVLMLVLSPR